MDMPSSNPLTGKNAHPELPVIYTEKAAQITDEKLLAKMDNVSHNLANANPVLDRVFKKYETESVLTRFGALMTAVHLAAQIVHKDKGPFGETVTDRLDWECEHAEELVAKFPQLNAQLPLDRYLPIVKLYRIILTDREEYEEICLQLIRSLISKGRYSEALNTVSKMRGEATDFSKFKVSQSNYREALERMSSLFPARRLDIPPQRRLEFESAYFQFAQWVVKELEEQGLLDEVGTAADMVEGLTGRRSRLVQFTPALIEEAAHQKNFAALWRLTDENTNPETLTTIALKVIDLREYDQLLKMYENMKPQGANAMIETAVNKIIREKDQAHYPIAWKMIDAISNKKLKNALTKELQKVDASR